MADGKTWLAEVMNRELGKVVGCARSWGGDRLLLEFKRDLHLIEFCEEVGIEPLALYVLGPEPEDLRHIVTIHRAGYFKAKRTLLISTRGLSKVGTPRR